MTYSSLLTHRINIQTKASSQNDLGEWGYTYTSATSLTDCRMSPLTAMERLDQSGRFDNVTYRCFLESGASILRDDRIAYNGLPYRVKEVILDSSYHHKLAYLMEIPE